MLGFLAGVAVVVLGFCLVVYAGKPEASGVHVIVCTVVGWVLICAGPVLVIG